MKIKKYIALGFSTLLLVGVAYLFFSWWSIDDRLQGSFKSTSHETINRALQINKDLGNKINLHNVKKLYEHSFLTIKGHKITQTIKPYTYQNLDGIRNFQEGFTIESYFLIQNKKRSNNWGFTSSNQLV